MTTPFRRVYYNASVHAVASLVSMAVGLGLTPFLLHGAGRAEYGLWVLSQTFSATSGYLALFGLGVQPAIVRMIGEAAGRGDEAAVAGILSVAARVYAVLGALGGAALLLFGETVGVRVFHIDPAQGSAAHTIFAIVAVQGFVEYLAWAYVATLEGWQRYDVTRTLELLRLGIFAIASIASVAAGWGAVGLAWATLLGVAGRTAGAVIAVRRRMPPGRPAGAPRAHTQWLRLVPSFSVINLAGIVYNVIDRTVISTMIGAQWLADYDVIAKVQTAASMPANVLPTVVPGSSAQLRGSGDHRALADLFLRLTRHSLYISLAATLTPFLLAPQILAVWIGPEYVRLAGPLRIYLAVLLFNAVLLVGGGLAAGSGPVGPLARLSVALTILNAAGSVLMTRLVGFPGTFLGTLISHAALWPVFVRYFCGTYDVSPWTFIRQSLLRPYGVAALYGALVVVFVLPWSGPGLLRLLGAGAACVALFTGLTWMLGVDRREREQAAAVFARFRGVSRLMAL